MDSTPTSHEDTTTTSQTGQRHNNATWHTPLSRITPLSKGLAMLLFITLPFVGFWLGVQHRSLQNEVAFQSHSQQSVGSTVFEGSSTVVSYDLVLDDMSVYFVKDGNLYRAEKHTATEVIVAGQDIQHYVLSADNSMVYFTNREGELIRKHTSGEFEYLVHKDRDFEYTGEIIDSRTSSTGEEILVHGKVGRFYLSPNEEWIAYERTVDVGGCCGFSVPVDALWIMRSDGTDKQEIVSYEDANIYFIEWMADSGSFVFYYQEPTTTSGSPHFIMTLDGVRSRLPGMEYTEREHYTDLYDTYVTIAAADAHFTSDKDMYVYQKDGLSGGTVFIVDVLTSSTTAIAELEGAADRLITWSSDGNHILLAQSTHIQLFTKNGVLEYEYTTEYTRGDLYQAAISDDGHTITLIFEEPNPDHNYLKYQFTALQIDTMSEQVESVSIQLPKEIRGDNGPVEYPVTLQQLNAPVYGSALVTVAPRFDYNSQTYGEAVSCNDAMRWCGLWSIDFEKETFKRVISGQVEQIQYRN